jgi:uncharacterized protein YjbI with pentapeptide repeats
MPDSHFLDVTSDDSLHGVATCKCRHYDICARHARDEDTDLCILHARDARKNPRLFSEALAAHRLSVGDNFIHFVFPGAMDFGGVHFSKGANFSHATFLDSVDFSEASFGGEAQFMATIFTKSASFFGSSFQGSANFDKAHFVDGAAYFGGASFVQGASFVRTRFGRGVLFDRARFGGDAVFIGGNLDQGVPTPMFAGVRVYFRGVVTDRNAGLTIVDADLRLCSLLDTDLSQARLARIIWPRFGKRPVVYDAIATSEREAVRPDQLHAIYSAISHAYTQQQQPGLAADFRHGVNELRRLNPDTALQTRLLLNLYHCFSDYGAKYLRPLGLGIVTAMLCAVLYMCAGITPLESTVARAVTHNAGSWHEALLYSFRAMLWASPERAAQVTGLGQWVALVEHALGPVFICAVVLGAKRQVRD